MTISILALTGTMLLWSAFIYVAAWRGFRVGYRRGAWQLEGELRLAEEGLANYEEEVQAMLAITRQRDEQIEALKAEVETARNAARDIAREAERLRALIDQALEWEPVFPLEASLIDEMWEAIGKKKPLGKCMDCGVEYVKGATHFSGCKSHPGEPVPQTGNVE